jgi:glycine cleavage system T protein (aminomethyltransferase)
MPKETPLLESHRRLGAKLTHFAGWEMPLQYSGIIAEHNAVRTNCGLFDVSHLGKLRVKGAAGGDALQTTVTADVLNLAAGRARYALVLNERAGCIDDLFVYRMAEDEWLVVPNAANVGAVADALKESGGEATDEWDRWAILAVQGPDSYEVFEKAFPGSGAAGLKLHRWGPVDVLGEEGLVARTGYTGERGFELYAPSAKAVRVWERLLESGCTPAGLGARDTLRLEMGYPLHGHELTPDTDPLEAGLGWAVAWDKPFRGKDALEAVRASGPKRRLFGLVCRDKGVPRRGYEVMANGEAVGDVTSGNYSPTLGTGIALGLGPADMTPAEGRQVHVVARGRQIEADIVNVPFVDRGGKDK